jgi:hypothetical protein
MNVEALEDRLSLIIHEALAHLSKADVAEALERLAAEIREGVFDPSVPD